MPEQRYIPGDYWMICDVCGFQYRRSQMRKRWDGAWVCPKDYERRHPQDSVKVRKERAGVPVARPDIDTAISSTEIKTAASKGDKTIDVDSISGIDDKDGIGIVLDGYGGTFWTYVNGDPSGNTVTLNDALPGPAAVDNDVYFSTGDYYLTSDISGSDL